MVNLNIQGCVISRIQKKKKNISMNEIFLKFGEMDELNIYVEEER